MKPGYSNDTAVFTRKRLLTFAALVAVFLAAFFMPASEPKEFVYVDLLGASIPVDIEDETVLVPKEVVQIFGQFEVSANWDCACTAWTAMDCGTGMCNVYHGASLYDSYPVSCFGGIDQDGRPCAGCCWRIDCAWINPASPPTISTSTSCGTPGNDGWCRGGAVLNVSAHEPQGDPMTVTCTNPAASATGSTSIGLPEGTGTANCTVTSAAGSDASSSSWKVDTVSPSNTPAESGATGNGGWYVSDVAVSVSGTDATSGVNQQRVGVDGAWAGSSATISANGTHAVTFQVTDNAGNRAESSRSIKIDKLAPSISPGISGATGDGGWYISSPTINLNGSDAHSGVASERVRVSGLGWQSSGYIIEADGNYMLEYEVVDHAGHISTASGAVRVDTTDPQMSVTIAGGGGANGWHMAPLLAGISGSDAMSGLKSAELSVDGGPWISGPVSFDVEGVFRLDARAVDHAGNVSSSSQSIRLDMTPPEMTPSLIGTPGNHGWYISPVAASVSGTDALSGIGAEQIRFNGGAWGASLGTISSEGAHTVDFRVVDLAGNTISATATAAIDLNPPLIEPSVSGSGSGSYFNAPVTVSVGASDSASGVLSEQVRIDGGGWVSPGTFALSDGSHLIEYRAEDRAGLVSTASETIQVDLTAPAVTLRMSNACSGDLTFTGTASDPAGLATSRIVIDGKSAPISIDGAGAWRYTTRLGDGQHDIVVEVADSAGNMASDSGRFKVDNTPPEIDLDNSWESFSYGSLSIEDGSLFSVTITGTGPNLEGKRNYSAAHGYPSRLSWRTVFPGGWANPGDLIQVKVVAQDACGNVSANMAQIIVVDPKTATPAPTMTPTPSPTPEATAALPEATQMAAVQPTAKAAAPREVIVVEAAAPEVDLYQLPIWLWGLIASAMIFGAGGVFIDPRPRQINRLARMREDRLDLFADTFQD
ncbi:MAG: Ig-like domain repeat protein [Anaerolineales bacterium]|nr:Ig-like domain repeat protein [Anaerolineales bacterium]